MKLTQLYVCLETWLGIALTASLASANEEYSLDLKIQMVPGIWITGATGTVTIEFTTNLDQTCGWAILTKVQATNFHFFYIDATATNAPTRFYRAVSELYPNPDPQHLVWINPGTFMMGSPPNEVGRSSDESPQTQVIISHGFWMSKWETTQEEYLAVMGTNPSAYTGNLKWPVELVFWENATNYCAKLTTRMHATGQLPKGYVYRLPTEAEWEYACRAGTTTRFNYGDDSGYDQLFNYAWYSSNFNYLLHAVGEKLPNSWGLYDMYGNVEEWCLDWYGSLPGGSVIDPLGSPLGMGRVVRGGGWNDVGWFCRSAARSLLRSDMAASVIGFRPVLAHDQCVQPLR